MLVITSATRLVLTTSSTPITAAIASRVRSSWVGPRPPHTMTASASASVVRSTDSTRPRLSPTFTCSSESMPFAASCSPSHALLVSTICPSSSSVPTATTSQRIERSALGRRARHMYWPPLIRASTTEIHSSPFHSHLASIAVSGAMAKPTDSCWVSVFNLAILLAGTLTPLAPTNVRYRLIASSRAAMMTTGTIQNTWLLTRKNIAPSTSTLSASGSRNAPTVVVPWRRARNPSMPSVLHSTNHRPNATHEPPGSSGISTNMNGAISTRATVTRFAQVLTADGSTGISSILPRGRDPWRPRFAPCGTRRPSGCVGTSMMPSISGASRLLRATPASSTSTFIVVADQRVATAGGDVVLQLAQLGQALVHQARLDGTVEADGVRAFLGAVREEAAPVELGLLDESQQLIVVLLGLARVADDEVAAERSIGLALDGCRRCGAGTDRRRPTGACAAAAAC